MQMTLDIVGQNFSTGSRRTDQQIMINDSMRYFMGRHTRVDILGVSTDTAAGAEYRNFSAGRRGSILEKSSIR